MSDGLNVGTVKGTVELEDRMSSAVDLLEHKIESLDAAFGGLGHHFVEQTASFFTAEAALDAVKEAAHLAAETLKEITIEGSHAADIEDTFEHLTEKAGQVGDVLLGKVREGLHGTVTDLEIMTRVNDNMVAGLKLSNDQWTQLANGAFTLAKAKGLETKDVLDKVSDALLTGRVRTLATITGKIDLAAAEDRYAASLGTTSDHLSEAGKLAAAQAAILDKVALATANAGEAHVRLADKVQQVKVAFANFEEEVGTAIATSPVLSAGIDGVRDALSSAFGSKQTDLIHVIAHAVDDLAIKLIDAAEGGVNAAAILGSEWNATKVVFGDIAQFIDGDVLVFKYLSEGVAEFGKVLHLPGAAEEVERIDTEIQSLMTRMVERGQALKADEKAENDWAVSSGKVIDALENIKRKMIDAKQQEGDFNDVIRDSAKAHKAAGDAADAHNRAESDAAMTMAMTKEELKKYNESWKNLTMVGATWRDTLATLRPEQIATIKYYLDAGVAVDQLAAAFPALTKNQVEAVKSANDYAKVEYETSTTVTKLYEAYFNKRSQLFDTDSVKAKSNAEKDYEEHVAELEKKGIVDVKYYNDYWTLRQLDVELADSQRLIEDQHSKAALDKKLADAKDYFQFILAHRLEYTQADVDAQRAEVDRLKDQRSHWGELGAAIDDVKDRVVVLDHEWVTDGDIAAATTNRTTVMVRTLTGELISLAEAQKRQHDGGSYAVTSQNFAQSLQSVITSGGWNPSGMGSNVDVSKAYDLAKAGYSFQEILDIFQRMKTSNGPIPPPQGPRIPGFRDGGIGDFGDGTLAVLHGKEAVLPLDNKALWDQLNDQQAKLWKDGKGDTREYADIIRRMDAIAPPGYGGRSTASVSSLGLQGTPAAVHIAPGAIVINYPIMSSPRSLDHLGEVAGEAFLRQLQHLGTSL